MLSLKFAYYRACTNATNITREKFGVVDDSNHYFWSVTFVSEYKRLGGV